MQHHTRLQVILEKIEKIQIIIDAYEGKISKALKEEVQAKPALLMHLVSIAEQFKRLKENDETEVLKHFSQDDLKGISDIRNFISHDYEGVDLSIIESAIRYGIPELKKVITQILTAKYQK